MPSSQCHSSFLLLQSVHQQALYPGFSVCASTRLKSYVTTNASKLNAEGYTPAMMRPQSKKKHRVPPSRTKTRSCRLSAAFYAVWKHFQIGLVSFELIAAYSNKYKSSVNQHLFRRRRNWSNSTFSVSSFTSSSAEGHTTKRTK